MNIHPSMARLYRAANELKNIDSQSALSRALNVSRQTVNNWESRGISNAGALLAEKAIGCSATWVESGHGTMLAGTGLAAPKLAREIEEVIAIMQATDDRGRLKILLAVQDEIERYMAHRNAVQPQASRYQMMSEVAGIGQLNERMGKQANKQLSIQQASNNMLVSPPARPGKAKSNTVTSHSATQGDTAQTSIDALSQSTSNAAAPPRHSNHQSSPKARSR